MSGILVTTLSDSIFLYKSQKDPTFGFYNMAHSDVIVFRSFKLKVQKTFMNSNE